MISRITIYSESKLKVFLMDALTGFEPVSADPESAVLPLNYKASKTLIILFKNKFFINLKFHLDF